MIIHIWMHWFWITAFICKGLLLSLSRHVLCSSSLFAEAGLLGRSHYILNEEDYFLLTGKITKGNASQDGKFRSRRNVEDEDATAEEGTTILSRLESAENITESSSSETSSGESGIYRGAVVSDVGDTYNGGNADGLQFPTKKYMKYGKHGKLKLKSKGAEAGGEEQKSAEASVAGQSEAPPSEIQSQGNETALIMESAERYDASMENGTLYSSNETDSMDRTGTELPRVDESAEVENGTVEEVRGLNATTENVVETLSTAMEDVLSLNVTTEGIRRPQFTTEEDRTNGTVSGVTQEGKSSTNETEDDSSADLDGNEMNLTAENKLEESVVHTTVEPFYFNNRVAAATSSETRERLSQPGLDAGSITGITLGIVVVFGFFGAVSFVLYRRRFLNKPQALNDKCSNLDSSGYIDDTSLRENSEEMYSLDNDSFLNSLEAMTIQNYWTENVKHTKL